MTSNGTAPVGVSKNIKQLGRMDLPGGGSIVVENGYAYVGHMDPPHGTSIIDVADPASPSEIGYFIPEPTAGRPAPQSNDVALDARGLIYVIDRHVGFDILEFAA